MGWLFSGQKPVKVSRKGMTVKVKGRSPIKKGKAFQPDRSKGMTGKYKKPTRGASRPKKSWR